MLNFSMWLHDDSIPEKEIVRISYRIVSTKRFKAMDENKKKVLIDMIERFETALAATKKEIDNQPK